MLLAAAAACRAEGFKVAANTGSRWELRSISDLESIRGSEADFSCRPGSRFPPGRVKNFERSSFQCRYQRLEPEWRTTGKILAGTAVNLSNAVAHESLGTNTGSRDVELTEVNVGEAQWTSFDSEALYRVQRWGSPYFFVSPEGHACVRLFGLPDGPAEVDLVEVIESLKTKNVQLPLVIRFPNILNHRMTQLQDSFNAAILKYGYKSHFQGVFPVKCNHDRFLVEEVVGFGKQYQFGLEAGSKPELLIAMTKLRKSRSALLVCNGYKAY